MENALWLSLTSTDMEQPTLLETYKVIIDALYFFVSLLGGVYIGYLFGFRDR